MSNIDRYAEQHERILTPARDILAILDSGNLAENEYAVGQLLSGLAGRLKLHLAVEDKSVYPALLNNPDEHVRIVARKFKDEVGDIYVVFNEYFKKWSSSAKIESSRDAFTRETRELFEALMDRITKEDKELYPLLA